MPIVIPDLPIGKGSLSDLLSLVVTSLEMDHEMDPTVGEESSDQYISKVLKKYQDQLFHIIVDEKKSREFFGEKMSPKQIHQQIYFAYLNGEVFSTDKEKKVFLFPTDRYVTRELYPEPKSWELKEGKLSLPWDPEAETEICAGEETEDYFLERPEQYAQGMKLLQKKIPDHFKERVLFDLLEKTLRGYRPQNVSEISEQLGLNQEGWEVSGKDIIIKLLADEEKK